MNLVTAAKMLVLLEQSQHGGVSDDAYFIIHRLLKAELRKGNDPEVLDAAYREFGKPSLEEIKIWNGGNKVGAIKAYRERTGAGLYHSKKAMEAAEQECALAGVGQEVLQANEEISGVTSCG
jgi:hypothetical protein